MKLRYGFSSVYSQPLESFMNLYNLVSFAGLFVFLVPKGSEFFLWLSSGVGKILEATAEGIKFCFGPLAVPPGSDGALGFILVVQGLPTIIFFAALMETLYFLRVMPFILKWFSRFFTRFMRVSGAESLCTASNIFVGIESATTADPNRLPGCHIDLFDDSGYLRHVLWARFSPVLKLIPGCQLSPCRSESNPLRCRRTKGITSTSSHTPQVVPRTYGSKGQR